MSTVLYVGMDVHSTSYTLATFAPGDREARFELKIAPECDQIVSYLNSVRRQVERELGEVEFVCGYEAGCLGYTLYHQLTGKGVACVIVAPTTILEAKSKRRVKTDRRDAALLAKSLAFGTYHAVHVPLAEDNAVKEYLRMRDDHQKKLKQVKQELLAFCLRHGYRFTEARSHWTKRHVAWLRRLEPVGLLREVLDEYLATLDSLTAKVASLDRRIEELSRGERYHERVRRLGCLLGVKERLALALLAEVGDFDRFESAGRFASFLGLTPGESSSGEHQKRLGITKAGNAHLRRLLVEASQSLCRGRIGYKSQALQARQRGNPTEVIAYADRANERMRRKHSRLIRRGVKRNVAVTAVARELGCFVWGMLTGRLAPRGEAEGGNPQQERGAAAGGVAAQR